MDEWRDIPGYEGIYQASKNGEIRTAPGKVTSNKRFPHRVWKTRILKPKFQKRNDGRIDARVHLWKDGTNKTWLVSRLVGLAWCDGFSENMTINHINGNSLDNRVENLEWVSLAENIQKSFETGLHTSHQRSIQLATEDKEVFSFASMADASRFLNRNKGYVYNCIKNRRAITNADGTRYFIRAVD